MPKESPLDIARQLDALGFNVLPARHKGKAPQVEWQRYQNERTTDKLHLLFSGSRPRNYWILTGRISGIAVLDCDSPEATTLWRERLGEVLDETASVKTGKGMHFYFRLPADRTVMSWSEHEGEISFDLRAENTGVIAPPSTHESGRKYEWVRGPEHIADLPEALFGAEKAAGGGGGAPARSMLADLLSKPPVAGERNVWLSRVAGHYAKHFFPMEDAYRAQVLMAAAVIEPPLDQKEVDKLVTSIWKAETRKGSDERAKDPDESNGWLVSGGEVMLTVVKYRQGDEWLESLEPWADFDIRALGVVEDEQALRVYDVEILRRRHSDRRNAMLESTVLADGRRLRAWLANLGVSILPPQREPKGHGDRSDRITRYLESQSPPHFRVVDSLGWHGDGFVCHEGIIRETGLHGFERRKPNPKLRNWAPYRYGFLDSELAQATLRDVLTFHDPEVCSVFGAWWAACFLKPQIQHVVSQFPFMALEAPSESGKTTGFFSLMLQLNGNTQGQVDLTRAALRDWMSANQSGIVWIDDLSDTSYLMDLLRQATGEGSVAKKGEDRHTQEVARLVAPVVISGEALQLHHQKALQDRAVTLDVPSPTTRRSIKDPSRLQWLDIVEMKETFPDLTVMAGSMAQLALQQAGLIEGIPSLVPESGGRFGDKMAIIRTGARVLAGMTGEQVHVERVDRWAEEQDDLGSENALTTKLIPEALRRTGWLRKPRGPDGRWPATPVFLSDGVVWFSPQHLASWWSEIQHGRVEVRTETAESLAQQARAMGLGGPESDKKTGSTRRRFNLDGDPSKKTHYWAIPGDLGKLCIARSRGEDVSRGVHPAELRLNLSMYGHPGEDPDQ